MSSTKRKGVHPHAYTRRKSDSWLKRQRRSSGTIPIPTAKEDAITVRRIIEIPELPDTLIRTDGPDPYNVVTREYTIEELWRVLMEDANFATENDK